MATSNPTDDKLAPFRQQAAIIARKKDSIAEQFSELKTQHNKLLEEINVSRIFELYNLRIPWKLRGAPHTKHSARLRQAGQR